MIAICNSAAERRYDVAMGGSPWELGYRIRLSPSGATRSHGRRIRVAPLGLGMMREASHELAPVATTCRPIGTESQVGDSQCL